MMLNSLYITGGTSPDSVLFCVESLCNDDDTSKFVLICGVFFARYIVLSLLNLFTLFEHILNVFK